jgi:hypothetical protein
VTADLAAGNVVVSDASHIDRDVISKGAGRERNGETIGWLRD